MERWIGRVALVTGASEGIGESISRELVRYGLKVVGCARSLEKLQKIANETLDEKGSFHPIRCDLTKEDEILKMFEQIKEKHGGADICINNAGVSHNAPLLSGDTDAWRNMLNVNVLALSICSRETVKSMKERNIDDGHIIHLNSMSGHRVSPSAATSFYTATKYAVTALTECLRNELRQMKSHIRITGISPGMVETDLWYKMNPDNPKSAEKLLKSLKTLEPKDISDAVIYVLGAPKHVQVHDILLRPTEQSR